jgi:hypothetical protein
VDVDKDKQLKTKIMKTLKTTELHETKQKENNIERFGDFGDNCICCGKRTNEDINNLWVHMSDAWEAINVNDNELDEIIESGGYLLRTQGFFPIGKTCAKKMRGFVFKYDEKLNEYILK